MRAALLLAAACACAWSQTVELPAAVVQDKIRGGLLGQILGDLNGLPYEMKFIAEPGSVPAYRPALPEGAWTDDDTDVEWVYIVEMERSGTLLLPPARIVELWKRHINRRIWCSNHYVRQLMDLGIEPPLTGHPRLNPWAAFNLSGQFVSEMWGLIAPGMPQTAARIGMHYTSVSISGEPAQATRMFAAMIATAFLTSDMNRVLDAGVASLDPRSRLREIVADVRRWHRENPKEWRATRRLLHDKYTLHNGGLEDRNGYALNAASAVAALLYGGGDFAPTALHAFNFGWDCDNNAATAGTVIGVMKGARWFAHQGWPIADRFRNTSRDAMPEDETITKFGSRLVALAGRVTGNTVNNWRIRTERPGGGAGTLPEPDLNPSIEEGNSAQELARAAYYAICLDRVAEFRRRDPERWRAALAALNGYLNVVQAVRKSPPISGAALRERATAAGLQ